MKYKNAVGTILPKVLIVVGAIWLMIYSVAIAIKKDNISIIYGLKTHWLLLLTLGIVYILIPFSVKVGIWSLIWAILIGAISVLFFIGTFIGNRNLNEIDYNSVWTYIHGVPYILLLIGSILWALLSFKKR